MSIPVDILENIIDILSQDDPNLLSTKSCSLVCHDFRDISRKHIFASIVLNDTYDEWSLPGSRNTKATTAMLNRLLFTVPDVAHYVRNLIYVITEDDLDNLSLVQIFNQITDLQSLTIWHDSEKKLKWNNNPLRPALLHLLHLPTLLHFDISSVDDFVLTDMIPCVNLKHFEFNRLGIIDTFPSNNPQTSIRLHKITAGKWSTDAISKLCSWQRRDGKPTIDFDSVSNISVSMSNLYEVEAAHLLFRHCHQLSDATISVNNSKLTLNGLSRMLHPSLRTLKHVSLTSLFEKGVDSDPLSGLVNELEVIRDDNVVETVTIDIRISTDSDSPRGDEWGMLDKTLARPGWPMLRRVSLIIVVYSYMRGEDGLEAALKSLPEKQFPNLTSNSHFAFDFAVTSD